MRRTGWSIGIATSMICALALFAHLGCEKTTARTAIVLNPTTQRAKRLSHMLIKGSWVEFPEAKLILHKEGDKLNAFLVSNDPPEVINPTYQGNRYYFEMALDTVDDVKNIAQAEFRYKGAS